MLFLSLMTRGGQPDLAIDCPPETLVGDLAEAISGATGMQVPKPVLRVVSRRAEPAGRDERLVSCDLHSGDTVSLVTDSGGPQARKAAATLAVLHGPDRGRVFSLAPGESSIGRVADVSLADLTVSRVHALIRVSDTIEVADAGSTNGVEVNGYPISGMARLEPGQSFTVGNTEMVVDRVDGVSVRATLGVPFNPPPRIFAAFQGTELEFPAPPEKPRVPPIPLMSAMIPLIVGFGLAAATRSLILVAFLAMSPLMIFASSYESRREMNRQFKEDMDEHEEAVTEAAARLQQMQTDEVEGRHTASPVVGEIAQWTRDRSIRLWERSADADDMLSLRVGTAQQPSMVRVSITPGGRTKDRKRLESRLLPTRHLAGLPVVSPLLEAGHVGVAGAETAVGLARSLILQAAVLHSPDALSIAAIVGERSRARWDWLKWLPHLRAPNAPVQGHLLASQPDPAVDLVERLTGLVEERTGDATSNPVRWGHRILVLIEQDAPIQPDRLATLMAEGPRAGVHVVFVGSSVNSLPRLCGAVIVAGATADVTQVSFAADGRTITNVNLEPVGLEAAQQVAQQLSPVIDISARQADGAALPRSVSLVDLLGGPEIMVQPKLVTERWAESQGLRGTVGRMAGSNLSIDMRVDGPHVLVAGTTGAGKSELLQSFISALALSHSPQKINFLLVDYKGGAAFKECKDLPHSVGLVTDLNTQEVRRVLISLNAEIHRRERLLNRSRAKDLIDYEKMRLPGTPANLLIIIDEFAALAKEVPEFVTGVVDVAQRGRSLGMHLVLATQRPAGVITDNIRANTNLRIALRVADDNESVDVIGTPAAGRIDRATPGRGVARVGPKEVLSFQAGYVGGYTSLEQGPVEIVVRGFTFDGLTALATQQPATKEISLAGGEEDLGPSDLQRIVDVSTESCSMLGIGPPHRPWLDPLPTVVGIEALAKDVEPVEAGEVLVGVADDPERQAQHPAKIDLATTGSVLVVGTGRSGKTAFLRTVATSIVLQPGGEPMDVYGLDFAGRGLSMLDPLPHVGAIIDAEDSERVVRLFRTLQATISARADRFAEAGVGDLREYHRRTGDRSERRIVVLLDGFQAFEATYEKVDRGELVDLLPRLISGGRSAGIHFVISADRRGSVRGAVFGLISTVLVLRQSSPDELSSLNLRPDSISLEAPPGRGYLGAREVQVALLGDPEGDSQAKAIRDLADRLTGITPAAPVLRLPSEVNRLDLPPVAAPGQAIVGLDGGTLSPTLVDLLEEHLCVFGPRQSGRTTTLAGLARSMTGVPGAPTAVLCTPAPSKLIDAAPWARTAVGAEATVAVLGELAKVSPADLGLGVVVFLDDFSDFGDSVEYPFVELLAQSRRLPIHFVVAAETRRVRVSYAGSALGELRHVHRGLLLQPSVLDDGDLFDVRLSSSATMRFPPGRGFLVTRTDISLVQVALP